MLNAMFREIQEILGADYGLFREFNPKSLYSDELLARYKHIGALYLNNGNPNFIPDGASMTLYYTLFLAMRVPQGQNTSDLTVDPLAALSKEMTGKLYAEGVEWKYVLNVGLPYSDGVLNAGADGAQFITYEIPITAVVASGVLLTNNAKAQLTIDTTTAFLKSVVSIVEVPSVQLENAVFVNDKTVDNVTYKGGETESLPIAKGWSLRVIKLYRPDEAIDVKIKNTARNAPETPITVNYQMGDELATSHVCYVHDVTFSNENGQAVVLSFTLSTAMRPV